MRDPNGPIPGFEDEFTGTVGKEKRIHKTHWHMRDELSLRAEEESEYEWVRIRPGRYVRRKKEKHE